MAVKDETPTSNFIIAGGETSGVWDNWTLLKEEELVVTKQLASTDEVVPLFLDTDYTVNPAGLGDENGGTIVFLTPQLPVVIGDVWTLSRKIVIDRDPDFPFEGQFDSSTVNDQYDKLTYISQDINRDVSGAVRKDPGVGDTLNPLIPQMVDRRALIAVDTGGGNFEFKFSEFDPDTPAQDAQDAADAAAASEQAAAISEGNAETAETNAGISETNAANSAADVNLPPIQGGDIGKILEVNPAENGYDLVPPGTGEGRVLQVLQGIKTDTQLVSGGLNPVFTPVANFSVTITPQNTANEVLITGVLNAITVNSVFGIGAIVRLKRNGVIVGNGDLAGNNRIPCMSSGGSAGLFGGGTSIPINFLDSPASTSALVYTVEFTTQEPLEDFAINRGSDDLDISLSGRSASYLTAMEIGA